MKIQRQKPRFITLAEGDIKRISSTGESIFMIHQ